MYLHELRIVNDGPIEDLAITLEVSGEDQPRPLIVVGENGSGKTNLLSIVADALVEGAAEHHSDVVSPSGGTARHFLRLVGGSTLRRGTAGGFALLRFVEAGNDLVYAQKAGTFPIENLPDDLSPKLRTAASWDVEGGSKKFSINQQLSRQIFRSGSYAYFPASRSEKPHWLNLDSLPMSAFPAKVRIDGRLGKQLYVENGVAVLAEWLPGLLLDSRPEVRPAVEGEYGGTWKIDDTTFTAFRGTRSKADKILQLILDDPGARFVWKNRFEGLQFKSVYFSGLLPVDALSSGQATLLSVFGTLLMHGDATGGPVEGATGICVIDEIDAHVHIDLAYRAIPALIAEFPHIQFILSAHSPLYVLGMKDQFGESGVQIIEMPSGNAVPAEGYREFQNALEVLRGTQGFDSAVTGIMNSKASPVVLCEGQTDPLYIRAAAELLGPRGMLDGVEVDWIGSVGPSGARNSGESALRRAWDLFESNPSLHTRPVLLLFDNDVNIQPADNGQMSRRVSPSNPANCKMSKGIENLLDEGVFEERFYSQTTRDTGNGKVVSTKVLNKVELCRHLCTDRRNPNDFRGFEPLLSSIRGWLESTKGPYAPEDQLPST